MESNKGKKTAKSKILLDGSSSGSLRMKPNSLFRVIKYKLGFQKGIANKTGGKEHIRS